MSYCDIEGRGVHDGLEVSVGTVGESVDNISLKVKRHWQPTQNSTEEECLHKHVTSHAEAAILEKKGCSRYQGKQGIEDCRDGGSNLGMFKNGPCVEKYCGELEEEEEERIRLMACRSERIISTQSPNQIKQVPLEGRDQTKGKKNRDGSVREVSLKMNLAGKEKKWYTKSRRTRTDISGRESKRRNREIRERSTPWTNVDNSR